MRSATSKHCGRCSGKGLFEQLFTTIIGRVRKSLIRHQITRHALTHGQDLLMALTICAGIYGGAVLYRVPLPELGVIFTQIIACIKGFQSNYQLFMEHVHGYRFCMKVISKAKSLRGGCASEMPSSFRAIRFFQTEAAKFVNTCL
jgi:hypothetical protein